MTLAIILVALISIFAVLVSNQLSNQIRSTTKTYNDMQGKYIAEAGIERVLQEASNQLNTKIDQAYNSPNTRISTTRLSKSSQVIDNMKKELNNLKNQLSNISNIAGISSIINKINSISTADELLNSVDSIRNYMLTILSNGNRNSRSSNIQSNIAKSVEYLHNAQHYAQVYKNKGVESLLLRNSNYWEDVNYNQRVINTFINSNEVQGIITNTSTCCAYLGWNYQSQNIHNKAWQINDMIWRYHDLFTNGNSNPLESQSVKNQLENINKAIDSIIDDINKIQIDMVNWYINGDYSKSNLENTFSLFDSIKYDYLYVKKKLGLAIEDNVELPPVRGDNDITLVLDNYTNNISTEKNKYRYEIEYQDESGNITKQITKPINITRDVNHNILSISDIEVDIVSSSYKINSQNNKIQYKMKTTVVFKMYKNNNFNVEYEIKSYGALPIK